MKKEFNFDERDDLFSDALDYVSRESRYLIMDSLYCSLHNNGYQIEGNTAESDVEWFARNLFSHLGKGRAQGHWDNFPDKDYYRKLAVKTLECLPSLMFRIASRCIEHSKAINTILKAEQAAQNAERRRIRAERCECPKCRVTGYDRCYCPKEDE